MTPVERVDGLRTQFVAVYVGVFYDKERRQWMAKFKNVKALVTNEMIFDETSIPFGKNIEKSRLRPNQSFTFWAKVANIGQYLPIYKLRNVTQVYRSADL